MNLRLTNPLVMFVLALFAILVFAMPGLAANWYVSPTGTDAGGTTCQNSGSPCKKIQTVINNALVLTGDTIRVRDNGDDPAPDYTENITIPAGKEITITAYPVNANDTPARVMALHDDESVFTIKANNVTIQGLEIYGATDTLVDVAAIEVDSGVSGAVIKKNKCGFGPGYKNKYGILLSDTGGGNNIESNTCNYNTDIGIFINAGSSGNMIQNNTCNFNTNAGIAARNSADSNAYQNNIASHNISTGIDIANSTKNDISGNTVEDNADYGISLGTDAVMNTVSGNKVRYNDQGTYGYGITIIGAHHNMVSQNEVTGNKIGIYLYGDTAQYNTFAGNTVSSNKETGIYADSVNPTANNWFYYNFLYANYDDLDFQANAAGNHFTTPTIAPWGYWFDTGDTRSSALGNYHSTYGGTDANGDGIGDSNHSEPNVVDPNPLMYKSDRYDLQTWFASGNRMYKGDQSKPGEIVALNDGVAVYFTADVKAAQDVVFNGDNGWSGRFWLTENMEGDGFGVGGPDDQISFTIGYTSDPSNPGLDFVAGPNGVSYGDGTTSQFFFTLFPPGTDFTIWAGKYLCLRLIMNDNVGSVATYNLLTGGGWLYAAARRTAPGTGPLTCMSPPREATPPAAAPWPPPGAPSAKP